MTRLLVPVLAVVLLAGCAGMGGKKAPPPKTLSHARFVRAADRACAANMRRQKGLKNPRNAASFVRELRVAIRSVERLIIVLHGLAPPPSAAVAFRRLLATVNLEDLVAHQLVDAIEAGAVHRAKRLARRLDVLDKRFDSRSRKLGLHVCAKAQ